MKKLWLSALTAVTLMTGMSFGTAAWAGGRHDHWHGRDRWERCDDDRRGWAPRHYPHGYYRPYREIREVYYAPAPRYYRPERVYYDDHRRYGSGVRGSITVDF
jgi:hypothetical protein